MSSDVKKLWPQPIPIIGGTGEYQSGKTRFGVSICPGPRTLVYDLEQSSASYEYIGFERIDVQKEMHAKFPRGYKHIDLWNWWLDHIRSIPAGKYDVIMVDPATDLETGLTDWVAANPGFFGHTAGQYASMSAIMWGDVKGLWKMVLADICARCQTFYFTAHLGVEWGKDKKPTDKKKVKGKETLRELASLFLWFNRDPNEKGERPNAPRARVIKGRLEVGSVVGDDVVSFQVLPPVLPEATPKAIRNYFANPVGKKAALDAGERLIEEKLSDDERLKLQAMIAEANRDAAEANREMAAIKTEAVQATPAATPTPQPSSPSGKTKPPASETLGVLYQQVKDAKTLDELKAVGAAMRKALTDGLVGEPENVIFKPHYLEKKAALEAAAAGSKS